MDLFGRAGCKLIYQMELDVEYLFDVLYIEASTDAGRWNGVDGWTGTTAGSFFEFKEALTPYDGESPSIFASGSWSLMGVVPVVVSI